MNSIINWPSSSRTIALIANGTLHNLPVMTSLIKSYDRVVAVDGGLRHCKQMSIRPDFLIGDFDSVDAGLLAQYDDVPSQRFNMDKDETDLELAIGAALTSGAEKIGIFGAMEKRADHALYNLYLMTRFPHKIIIETSSETLFTLTNNCEIPCSPGQQLSLLPFGPCAKGVTTNGLKWELSNAVLDKNFASISNVCTSSVVALSICEGEVICCMERKKV